MILKIDTKEKFHVITIPEVNLSANMTDDIRNSLVEFLQKDVKNLVLCLQHVPHIDETTAEGLAKLQQEFYENQASFVICGLQKTVEAELDSYCLLEIMNVTPSESEAWDIVQMEEIERELLGE
jgi:anti-anti-sigma factor